MSRYSICTRTTAWPAKCKVFTTRQAQITHLHYLAFIYNSLHKAKRTHRGPDFQKRCYCSQLSLKIQTYYFFQNGRQKTFSAKRPSKNGQIKPNGQPKNRTANQTEIQPNFLNLAAKRPIWQPCRKCRKCYTTDTDDYYVKHTVRT